MPEFAVVDASAILDAATPGPRFDLFSRLHERFASTAPALLSWELGSVVHGRKGRKFGATISKRSEALDLLLAGVDLVPTDERSRIATAALSSKHALTFYDASYLELAARDDARVLVTQDRALLAAGARELGAQRVSDVDGIASLILRAGD